MQNTFSWNAVSTDVNGKALPAGAPVTYRVMRTGQDGKPVKVYEGPALQCTDANVPMGDVLKYEPFAIVGQTVSKPGLGLTEVTLEPAAPTGFALVSITP